MTLLGLAIAPVANILTHRDQPMRNWFDRKFLFNLDFVVSWASDIAYRAGISVNPSQVVIGYDGWLYLGDMYAQTRTIAREGATPASRATDAKIGESLLRWEHWLRGQGVTAFRVMLSPNKETIYPEYLPRWAAPATPSRADGLLDGPARAIYIDLRPVLLAAKRTQPYPLFYRTDTHWNALGGWIAYLRLFDELKKIDPTLHAFGAADLVDIRAQPRNGGDLARFLYLQNELKDEEVMLSIPALATSPSETREIRRSEAFSLNGESMAAPFDLTIATTAHPLNQKRLLWLADSFGGALMPVMLPTFAQTIRIHHHAAFRHPEDLLPIVRAFKPDYVVVTTVEREAWGVNFLNSPP